MDAAGALRMMLRRNDVELDLETRPRFTIIKPGFPLASGCKILCEHSRENRGSVETMLTGIAHVNLTVPAGTLHQAEAFYGDTLGMQSVPVPALQKNTLRW